MHVILDARKLDERTAAHKYLKKIFSFPDFYGENLDALYDLLSEMRDLHIHLIHTEEADNYFEKVMSVFRDLPRAEIDIIDTY